MCVYVCVCVCVVVVIYSARLRAGAGACTRMCTKAGHREKIAHTLVRIA